jgi:hypothetical protein
MTSIIREISGVFSRWIIGRFSLRGDGAQQRRVAALLRCCGAAVLRFMRPLFSRANEQSPRLHASAVAVLAISKRSAFLQNRLFTWAIAHNFELSTFIKNGV